MEKEPIALYGGTPVRENKIYYGHQWIDDEDVAAVAEAVKADAITCGPTVTRLEQALCEVTGAKYCVAVSNGTAALHCAAIAAGLKAGDEMITTAITFAASANCAAFQGAKPVFADINPETYNIDPDSIEAHITPATKAVVAVDFTGQAVECERIRALCEKHNLIFIEDAAHSIGTKYNGRPVGSVADMTCFSFHPVKTVTSGEGGAITTNDETLYKKLRLAATHGITKNQEDFLDKSEEALEGPWYYEMISLGYNYRLTDIQAALLLSQLKKLPMFSARRKEIVARYNEAFENTPGILVQKEIAASDSTRHLYIIRIDEEKLSCSRAEFFKAMAAENVQCQIHYVPVYWFPYYREVWGYEKGECPNAEAVYRGILSIPLYPKMSDRDVTDVITAVQKVAKYYEK